MNEIDIYNRGFANGAFFALLFQFVGITILAVLFAVCRVIWKGEENERQI